MYGILTRANWEQKSANAVSQFMKTPTEVRATGEQWNNLPDVVIRWGCTANVPVKNVINKAKAIHLVNNKAGFRNVVRNTSADDVLCT